MPETRNGFSLYRENNGLAYLQAALLSETGWVDHAFSTRLGGLSSGPLASLNTGFHVGDDSEKVLENRRIFFEHFSYDYRTIVSSTQVHGTEIGVFDAKNTGEGAFPGTTRSRCDGLVTEVPGLPLTAYSADCQILFFASQKPRPLIALAHAGWKGTLGDIGGRMVRFLEENYSADPGQIKAGLGPVVGRRCYIVELVVASKFQAAGWDGEDYLEPTGGGAYYLDLDAINLEQLRRAGLKEANLALNGWCTACHPDLFYSYRRDKGVTGRMLGFIAIK